MWKPDPKKSLLSRYPEVAKEWHPTKNGDLTPDEVFPKSDRRVWFLCSKNKTHEWEARIADRTSRNSGCPYCYRRVSPETSLASKFPEIAKDWHPTKNKKMTPEQVAPKSNKFFWWVCNKGHDYKMQPYERVLHHRGCTECSRYGGSAQETRIYCEIKKLFPETEYRHKIEGSEIDIFIPSISVGIEYDGEFYHRKKVDKDIAKNTLMKRLGLILIRVREHPLEKISDLDVITPVRVVSKNDVDELLKAISSVSPSTKEAVMSYLKEPDFINQEEFSVYMSYFPSPFPEKSLAEVYPEVAAQWDYEKNHPLTPYNFTHGSKHRVWWICENGHSHQTTINHKTWRRKSRNKACKFCRQSRVPPNKAQMKLFDQDD